MERVKTFTTNNWAAKPLELSPLHCAQYGWSNTHLDHLECVTCKATLYAGIPDEWDSTAYMEICNKLQSDLQIGHKELCPWPNNPCPRSFLTLPRYTGEKWKEEIMVAFKGLIQLKSNLPELCEDEVATMKVLDNSCMEALMSTVFKHSNNDCDDEALQGKVACILAVTGWSASQPIVEDPSITCTVCGKEAGLWNYKTLAHRGHHKRIKESFEGKCASQQSLATDNLSSNVSVKSEKSENSNHSGSVVHEISRLVTSSDSLANSDLLKPAGSQESLVNLRVSDSKQMTVEHTYDQDSIISEGHNHDRSFTEPRVPVATPPELMKELLLSTAPGSNRTTSIYSDSVFSEVGSECFEKRLEDDTNEKELELDKAISENPPSSHPNHVQQQWMKELLFMTAESRDHPEVTDSVISEIGSTSFDKRLDNGSVLNSPRSTTPVHTSSIDVDENEPQIRTKRMRFQDPDIILFSILGEHRPWCPWITQTVTEYKDVDKDFNVCFSSQSKNIPGWRVILGLILPSFRINSGSITSSPNNEAWKSVRSALHDCVSTTID